MYVKRPKNPIAIRLPDGSLFSLSDLPPTDTVRWVARRKLAVVRAVIGGLLTEGEAQDRYQISKEELKEWVLSGKQSGAEGLKATKRIC